MARRNQRKGEWLATDDYTGFTVYASKLKRDFWGALAVKPLLRNLQEIASPLNDPEPVPFYRGPNYEITQACTGSTSPFTVGLTDVPTNNDNMAAQALNLSPAIPDMEVGCTFQVYPQANYIESVQPVTVTIAAGASSGTATITAVDTTRTLLVPGYIRGGDSIYLFNEDSPGATLTNSTTVTALTNTANAAASRIFCCTAVEFNSMAVESVQYGTISIAANSTTGTATITNVDTARSAVVWLGQTGAESVTSRGAQEVRFTLTNGTTVTGTRGISNVNAVTGYFAVVYFTSIVKSVQQVSINIGAGTGAESSRTATINSVNTANTALLYGGMTVNTTGLGFNPQYCPYMTLTDATTVTAARAISSTSDTFGNVTVVEFIPGVMKLVQRSVSDIAANTVSDTDSITAVDTSRAFASFCGFSRNLNATNMDTACPTVALTNPTTVTFTRGATSATAVHSISWEVVEFWLGDQS